MFVVTLFVKTDSAKVEVDSAVHLVHEEGRWPASIVLRRSLDKSVLMSTFQVYEVIGGRSLISQFSCSIIDDERELI